MEQLAEAWAVWQRAIELFNRAAWLRASQSREAQRQTREAHATALAEQRHVSELLGDGD